MAETVRFYDRSKYARLKSGDRVAVSRLNREIFLTLVSAPISVRHATLVRLQADEVERLIRDLAKAARDAGTLVLF